MPVEIGQKQLKDAKDGIIHVTHNNGRVIYTIAIDIAKEGTEIWDLTPYFKARVNDSNAQLKVTWYQQGELLNLEGKKPYIEGNVGDYYVDDQKQIQLDGNAQPVSYNGDPIDFGEGGRATYRFPDEMFPKQGIFKGYIGVADDKGRVSGVTIWFKVLPGLAKMGHAKEVYVSEIEDMKLQFAAQQRAAISDAKQKLDDTVQSMNADYQKALDEHNKNFDAEMQKINDELDLANRLAKGVADSNNVLSQAVDANSEAIKNGMAPILNQSNVFQAQNTFMQAAVMQNGATVNGKFLLNGTDVTQLVDKVNSLELEVKKLQGGTN